MTYLGPVELKARVGKDILLTPAPAPKPVAKSSWDLDLRLGDEAFVSSGKAVQKLQDRDSVTIEPGEFAFLLTLEHLELPLDVVGFISVKFTHKAKGLINVSGFHVDPGYKGHLIFSVYNAGPRPIMLRRGDPVFMMGLSKLASKAPPRSGRGFSSIEAEYGTFVMAPPVSVLQLDKRVTALDGRLATLEGRKTEARQTRIQVWVAVVSAIIGGAIGALITKLISG